MLAQVHPVLFERAHSGHSPKSREAASRNSDPLGARASVDPFPARTAMALLRRVRSVVQAHDLTTAELDEASAPYQAPSIEAYGLASVALQDATRFAD